jgi:isoleucyl-tRNA synthetase
VLFRSQEVIRAVKAGSWSADGDAVTAGGVTLQPGEYELALTSADPGSTAPLPGTSGLIALDMTVTPELALEGTARDVVRVIQQARKDAGLAVSDRISLLVGASGQVAEAVAAHRAFISGETLAVDLRVVPPGEADASPQPAGDGGEVRVRVSRIPRP